MQILRHLDGLEPYEPTHGVRHMILHSICCIWNGKEDQDCIKLLLFINTRSEVCNADIYPVATSHILIVLSRDADSTKSPAGTKATDDTL